CCCRMAPSGRSARRTKSFRFSWASPPTTRPHAPPPRQPGDRIVNANTALGHDRPAIVIGRSLRQTLFAGTAVVVTFFAGFGTWAAWAPLSGAAVAPAVISPEGKRRTVQHLEGGIVRELLVR